MRRRAEDAIRAGTVIRVRRIVAVRALASLGPVRVAAARTRSVNDVAGLQVPVLGIAGAEDIVIAPQAVETLLRAMPNGRYEEVPSAGHSVYFERADTFNRLVKDFLTE